MTEPQITTKDVVLLLDGKVDQLIRDVGDLKVIAGAVGSNVETLHDHELRLRDLERDRAEGTGERKYRRFVWPSVWGAVVAAAAWLPDLFRHHS